MFFPCKGNAHAPWDPQWEVVVNVTREPYLRGWPAGTLLGFPREGGISESELPRQREQCVQRLWGSGKGVGWAHGTGVGRKQVWHTWNGAVGGKVYR